MNQILIIGRKTNLENVEIGQRVSIPLTNHTGRYIGDNKIIYLENEKPRLVRIMNTVMHDEHIDKKSKEYRIYNKILGKIKYDSK